VPMTFVLKSQNTPIATFFSSQKTTLSLSLFYRRQMLLLLKLLQRNRCARTVHDASSASFRSSSALVWRHSNEYSSEASSFTTTTAAAEEEEEFTRKEKATTTKKKKKQFQRRKLKEASTATSTKAKTKYEIEQERRMEVVDLNLDWGDKVYRGNATEYAGVKVTSKLTWPMPMHALVQLNPELRSVLNLSPPTEEEEAEADKFLSVLRKIRTDDVDFKLTELEEGEGEDEGEVTTSSTTKKMKRKEVEGDAKRENINALFPASMPYAHIFEAILLEAREHFPGGSRPESTRRQITKSLLQLVPRELLEDAAEEMKIWIRPAPKQRKRSVDSFRKAQKRLNFLYWLTEHWRKPAVNGKDLAITKGELGALIWSQYLEALKAVRGTNDAKFLADMISKDSSDTDEIELKHVRTGGWASGSQHRAKEYVDRLTGKVSTPSSSSSSSSSSEVKEDDDDVSSSTIERMDYPELFTPNEIVDILVKARGKDVMAIRIREKCSWADWLILCTGKSPRHISDLSHAVMFEFKKRVAENPTKSSGKVKPYIEGAQADMSGSGDEEWNAVDCGSCVIHVLSDRARRYYDIEELWANGDEILHNGEEILTIDNIKID